MASKSVFVPIATLGTSGRVGFLEFNVEAAKPDGKDPLADLCYPGLVKATEAARRAWMMISPPCACTIQVVGAPPPITHSVGAGLGLSLCPFFWHDSPYAVAVVMGELIFCPDGNIMVGAVAKLADKLVSIQQLGYRPKPMLLILQNENLTAAEQVLLHSFADYNVAVRKVSTLAQAIQSCSGRLTDK